MSGTDIRPTWTSRTRGRPRCGTPRPVHIAVSPTRVLTNHRTNRLSASIAYAFAGTPHKASIGYAYAGTSRCTELRCAATARSTPSWSAPGQAPGSRVQGPGSICRDQGPGSRGFRVPKIQSSGDSEFRVQSPSFRVQGPGFKLNGPELRV
eukprot:3932542-Rhodomonas_salina.1